MKLFDTSVIIDARDKDSPWHDWARAQITDAVTGEGGGINAVTLAEAAVRHTAPDALPALVESWGLALLPLPIPAAVPAAKAFRVYLDRRQAEGKPTENRLPLPDFLIGAHALAESLPLVTRDPARVKTYFPAVKLVLP